MKVLYLDVLLITNLAIDYLLLRSAALVLGRRGGGVRVFAGAVLSSLASLVILLPQLKAVALAAYKLLTAGAVCMLAFGAKSVGGVLKSVAAFLLVSFVYGGAVYCVTNALGASAVFNNMCFYFESTPVFLVSVITCFYLLINVGVRLWRSRAPANAALKLTLTTDRASEDCTAFIDTGNKLRDPLGEGTVIIIDVRMAEKLLDEAQNALSCRVLRDGASAAASVECRFRLIPYTSIGGAGLLPAFAGKSCEFVWRGKKYALEKPMLAVSDRCTCEAIISFDALKNL